LCGGENNEWLLLVKKDDDLKLWRKTDRRNQTSFCSDCIFFLEFSRLHHRIRWMEVCRGTKVRGRTESNVNKDVGQSKVQEQEKVELQEMQW